MPLHTPKLLRATAVALTLAGPSVPAALAQPSVGPTVYHVRIDGNDAGVATHAENLPETAALEPRTPTHVPARRVAAPVQASVILTTADSTLVHAIRAWMGVNNSGDKDTVQPKTVEITDVLPTGNPVRYVLHGAFPSRIDTGSGGTAVTIVYGHAEVVH